MSTIRGATLAALCAALILPPPARAASPASPDDLRAQFERLSTRAIFFGHQSVGINMMKGVRALLAATPGAPFEVVASLAAADQRKGALGNFWIGDNGDPVGKIAAFRGVILGGVGAKVDIAFMKFCYDDFWDRVNTDVPSLFATYRSTMAQLQAAFPKVTFVHVTVPLWTKTDTNKRREQFSELVRRTYGGKEPVFDLALVESTRPDGKRELDERGVPALVPAFTDDGGHLNAKGQEVVARALIAYLASLP
jgi:hypothetical protein